MTDGAMKSGARPIDRGRASRDGGGAAAFSFERPLRRMTKQRLIGGVLAVASLSGIVMLGAWLHPDPYEGIAYWIDRAAVQSVYAALFALFLWSLLRRRRPIAYLLIFGLVLGGVVSYHGAAAYRANHERIAANKVLAALRTGSRDAEDLSEAERFNPYVDAYLVMRDVYWELHERSEARMAHYRRLYEKYTWRGGFLDGERLGSTYDLWYSYFQIYELKQWLDRAEASAIDISDLLWTANILDVDGGTRTAYADDLRAAAAAIEEAQEASIAHERKTLQEMQRALEVLIDADGYFRVIGAQIIFERPEDAARFAGKTATDDGN